MKTSKAREAGISVTKLASTASADVKETLSLDLKMRIVFSFQEAIYEKKKADIQAKKGEAFESKISFAVDGDALTILDVLDSVLDRSSFTIACLERGEVLHTVCKVNTLHSILKEVYPSWSAFTDEEGWEAKVKILESPHDILQNPDHTKYYMHLKLQMKEMGTCLHAQDCVPCHSTAQKLHAITQTAVTAASTAHKYKKQTIFRRISVTFTFFFMCRKNTLGGLTLAN